MRPLLILLVLLVGLAAVLYATGAFEVIGDATGVDGEPLPSGEAPETSDAPGTDRGSAGLTTTPRDAPDLVIPTLREPAAVLVIARRPGSWIKRVVGALSATRNLNYQTWYTVSNSVTPDGEAGPGEVKGMAAPLGGAPDAPYLDNSDIRAVILRDIDPNALPDAFWEALAERMRAKRTGLWVQMNIPQSDTGDGLAAHPMLTHPVLGPLLPVAETPPLDADPVPGLLFDARNFALTEAGATHPASRLTPWPRWSRTFWEQTRSGPHAWATKFCYPVTALTPKAVTLLEVEVRAADRMPALVVGPEGGPRIVWQGFVDFGRPAFMESTSNARMGAWMGQVAAYLVGQAMP